jgi:hypothetical protein
MTTLLLDTLTNTCVRVTVIQDLSRHLVMKSMATQYLDHVPNLDLIQMSYLSSSHTCQMHCASRGKAGTSTLSFHPSALTEVPRPGY